MWDASADLDALAKVISTLQTRIERDHETIGVNETRTRLMLIDPLLQALGWDVSDPSLVIPEYSAGGGAADYALLKMAPEEGAEPIAFIEAKRLNESLPGYRSQMLNYANMTGVKYAGLTNGDQWEFYEVFKQAPLDQRRILNVSLRQESAFDCAVQLMWLQWPTLETGNLLSKEEAQTLLFKAVNAKAAPRVIAMLLDRGADCTVELRGGSTLLH